MVRAVIQRVNQANLICDGENFGSIEKGLVVLVCFMKEDNEKTLRWMINKVINLRVFEDENSKFNLSLKDVNGDIMWVSQFTLAADIKKGTRPSFSNALEPEKAKTLWENFKSLVVEELEKNNYSCKNIFSKFASTMHVNLTNFGPVTLIIDRQL